MMKILIRTTGTRNIAPVVASVPGLIIVRDRMRDAMDTFLMALEQAGPAPAIHLEDDVILCDGFCGRAGKEISARPGAVIQFFSMRQADLTEGSRWITGSKFMCNVCFYLPADMGIELLEYAGRWPRRAEHPTGCDLMLADFLKERRARYWNVVPNLADHRVGKSLLGARSSRRQSLTFKELR